MERWGRKCWSCRLTHRDGWHTCCSNPVMLNSPSELISHTNCFSIPLFFYPPSFHQCQTFPISIPEISFLSLASFSFQVFPVLCFPAISHTSPLPWPSILFYCFPCVLSLTTPVYCVCQHQREEPWKCHTNKVRGNISVSHGDTFINGRSARLCRCSITSSGACLWGAQHVWCASKCACARLCGFLLSGSAGFTVDLVGVDNSIREETDLEAEWRRKREMTAWSLSDQLCLVMTPWCVHRGHTKQTLIALHHLPLCSVVCRLTGSFMAFYENCYVLEHVFSLFFPACF